MESASSKYAGEEDETFGIPIHSRQRSFKDRLKDGITGSLSFQSRRASTQDVDNGPRNSDFLGPFLRSKSRSVDQGLSSPFDLDALRSKVEGRFESVDKLNKDAEVKEKKYEPPIKTIEYTVSDRDTLTSIAARFDTTPSELTKINRLGTLFVFPGQTLRVPDHTDPGLDVIPGTHSTPVSSVDITNESITATSNDSHEDNNLPPPEDELLENLRPVSPKPGHIERVRANAAGGSSANTTLDPEDEQAFRERFLKINVKHITDGQGVVGGVLLVTPNAVMFDPNVSDPLVIEHGSESYGVIAPMEFVVAAAIYYDIAHMRVGNAANKLEEKRPEIYHGPSSTPKTTASCSGKCSPGDSSLLAKDETFPELDHADDEDDGGGGGVIKNGDDNANDELDSVCSCERGGNAFPKAFERELITPTMLDENNDVMNSQLTRTLEERRKSMLDHHWPMSTKDRSLDDSTTDDTPAPTPAMVSAPLSAPPVPDPSQSPSLVHYNNDDASLIKSSYHDSGIDITDPIPIVPTIPTKKPVNCQGSDKVYSDADIVLSTDWVPPIKIATVSDGQNEMVDDAPPVNTVTRTMSATLETITPVGGRKKTSSVSFSLENNNEKLGENIKDEGDKGETRKNKMLKRLSYPLAWMETLAGSEDDKLPGLPQSASDAHHSSVFSKVFSSSPINLVSEFGTGLFLNKTPSEESGGSGGPPSANSLYSGDHCANTSAIFTTAAITDPHAAVNTAGRSSVGAFIRSSTNNSSSESAKLSKQMPKLDYRSMVSMDDMPELFVSFDKLIPRPARSCEDPPLYLRLCMGKPSNRPIPRSTPLMSYGKKKMRPEYWFSVPKNRVDDLYRFLQLWVPQRYGELTDDEIRARGFDPIDSDTELWDDDSPSGRRGSRSASQDQDIEFSKESWELIKAPYEKIYSILKTQAGSSDLDPSMDLEVISRNEELRRALQNFSTDSLDIELAPPDLVGTTEILEDEHREKLCRHLPARAEGYLWTLVFSTSQHGFSLNSMYRKMHKLESPILLVIQDTENNVFGALTSCSLKVSDHFYGTGESLLFRFTPKFQVYNWTGENLYFIKGNNESLAIGAGNGKFGIWLDGDLNQGRTEACSTYGNEPLTPSVDFVVKTLECWAFI